MSDRPIDLEFARSVLRTEADAVLRMGDAVNDAFAAACQAMLRCDGSVLVSGVGKAGHVARKFTATLASTGTPAHFLSPLDATHGDLGAVRRGDVIVLLSHSGESGELVGLMDVVKRLGNRILAITATPGSTLGRYADITIATGRIDEACPLGLAPSASTTAMMALCDAIALTVMRARQFTAEDFAIFHPAGQLGRTMLKVHEAMTFRAGENLPVSRDDQTVGQVMEAASRIKRRCGAVILIDGAGKLCGLLTDGDFRRLLIAHPDTLLQTPVAEVMTRNPKTIGHQQLASNALGVMHRHRIDELPVVDDAHQPVGLIDIQDLLVLRLAEPSDGLPGTSPGTPEEVA